MKFKLNCTPHLRMHEITKKLFNNEFLSDIQFKVNGKILFAHSLELMKRSEIFEEELLQNFGKTKTFKIDNCSFAIFFEFIKFIYTDDCEINHSNGIGLLKLATKYNVIILKNKIINSLATVEWIVQLFDHCMIKKYDIVREQISDLISANFDDCMKSKEFLSIQLDSVFKMADLRDESTKISQLDETVINWVAYNKTPLGYIGNIDNGSILGMFKRHVQRTSHTNKRRYRFEWRKFKCKTVFETTFSVSQEMILHALWIGIEENRKDIEIIIKENNVHIVFISNEISFTQSAPDYWQPMLIALGKSIVLRPNCEYTVTIKYLGIAAGDINVVCRMKDVDLIVDNCTREAIKNLKSSDNMLELLLIQPIRPKQLLTNCITS